MSNLVPFLFGENTIRVIPSETGEPLFVAKDVAKALEYTSKLSLMNGRVAIGLLPLEESRTYSS